MSKIIDIISTINIGLSWAIYGMIYYNIFLLDFLTAFYLLLGSILTKIIHYVLVLLKFKYCGSIIKESVLNSNKGRQSIIDKYKIPYNIPMAVIYQIYMIIAKHSLMVIFNFLLLLVYPITFINKPLKSKLTHMVLKLLGKAWNLFMFVNIEVKYSSNIDINKNYIYTPNHTSVYDIIGIYSSIPTKFHTLAWGETFKLPMTGLSVLLSNAISVNLTKTSKSKFDIIEKSVNQQKDYNESILIFPEGTLNCNNDLKEFHKGYEYLHKKISDIEVIPVVIHGANVYNNITKQIHIVGTKVTIEYLDPTNDVTSVKSLIQNRLNELDKVYKTNKAK